MAGPVIPERYRAALGDDDPFLAMFEAPQALRKLLKGLTEKQLSRRPAPGKWSIKEIVAHLAAVSGMLEVLGIHPKAPEWSAQSSGTDLTPVVDGLVGALLDQRATARQAKDWAAADAIRDTLAGLGLEITDTPTGPRWSLEKK